MKDNDKVMLGWYVPSECRRHFTEFCADVGDVTQDACAGALTIWQYLPAAIREQAKKQAKGIDALDKDFWDSFRQGLELAIKAQSDNLRKKQEDL